MSRRKVSGSALALTVVGLAASLAPTVSTAGEFSGHINFLAGLKALNEDDWLPFEKQVGVGVEGTWGAEGWPVWIATDFYRSHDSGDVSGSKVDAVTEEVGVGIRRVWSNDNAYTYLGLGVDYLSAKLEAAGESEDDSTLGGWVGGAIFWRVGEHANVGVALRYSSGRVTLFDEETEAGGFQSGLLLGWGWPLEE